MSRQVNIAANLFRKAAGLALAASVLVVPAEAAVQAAHRAVYDLALVRATDKAGVDSVDGRLVFEVSGDACEGYAVNSRLVNRYNYREGASRLIDLQNSTFEAGDAKSFEYQAKEFIDAKLASDKRSSVSRSTPGAAAEGELKSPAKKDFKLEAGVLFPVQHQLLIVEAAKAGKNRLVATVFDGSDEEKTAQVVATIGKRIEPGQSRDKDDKAAVALKAVAAWPVTLAYFPAGTNEDTPSFQSSFLLYENGVSTNLSLDYGDMTLSGKIAKLEMLGAPSTCK